MKTWLRRIRGAIGVGLTWAFAWFLAGMVLLFIVGFGAADVPFPLFFGLLGFLSGVTFSGLLGLAEGRRRFDQMSMPRFALWGGLGGVLLSLGMGLLIGEAPVALLSGVFGLAGAGCAAGTLGLARMAEDQELLEAGEDVEDVGLTEAEATELLGDG